MPIKYRSRKANQANTAVHGQLATLTNTTISFTIDLLLTKRQPLLGGINPKSLSEETIDMKVGGRPINNIRFADGVVLTTRCLEDLQKQSVHVVEANEENGSALKIENTKTKLSQFSCS